MIIPSSIILTHRDLKAGDNPKPLAEVSCNLVACNTSLKLAMGNNQPRNIYPNLADK